MSRVIFSVSQAMFQQLSGGRPKPAIEELLNAHVRRVVVLGPLLVDEGMVVFDGYAFTPKAARHRTCDP